MSLLKSPPEMPAISIPFKIRMEPYLVESVCELARLVREKGNQRSDISGLLFGSSEPGMRTVEALKTFVDAGPHSDLARRERLEKAYRSTTEEAKRDPELAALEVVGWFSFRNGTGLLSSDVTFHNQHFRKTEDLALIVWREGPSQITAEVYAKADSDSLTAEDYRWGSVRLSADIRHMTEPVELAMRLKLADDSYLRNYDDEEPQSGFGSFIRKAEAASDKFFGFLYKRKEEEQRAQVRGLIGDGRLPNRAHWAPEAREQAPSPELYFNPYADPAKGMHLAGADATGQQAAAAGGYAAWPGNGVASAPAPARNADQRTDFKFADPRRPVAPLQLPPAAPLDLGKVGQSPRSGRAAQTEVSGVPMLLRPPEPVKKPFPWRLAAALFVICSGAVFAFLALGGLQSDGGRLGQAFHAMFPGGELNLRVRTEDDRLRLTWNQRNHAVAAATDGVLQIFDGQQHREVHLEGRQVADGSVLYRPLTNDVTFRLEVRGEQGGVSGSIRVLDGLSGQQQVLDVSAPPVGGVPAQNAANASAPLQQQPLSDPATAKNVGEPKLIRPGSTTGDSGETAPITESPYVAASRAGAKTYPTPSGRYETPQTIGTLPGSGTTINGWDTSSSKSRARQLRAQRTASKAAVPSIGFVAPRPLMQVMPRTGAIPSGTIQSRTRVEVQVQVDPSGKVAAAHVVGSGVNESVASAALAAARQWTFEPASSNGQRVQSDHTIVFEFRPER